jgi:hypothetical protein
MQIEMTTPYGLLRVVSYPQEQRVYDTMHDPEPVAQLTAQDPTPTCTLDGKGISLDRAKAIVAEMQAAASGE